MNKGYDYVGYFVLTGTQLLYKQLLLQILADINNITSATCHCIVGRVISILNITLTYTISLP